MPKRVCEYCSGRPPSLKRPKDNKLICKQCFLAIFEEETHETIITNKLFKRGETIAIGASGGKDSTVLIELLDTLNKRHDYAINLVLLSIDEGIKGYREPSIEAVRRNQEKYNLPLKVVSYAELYGWTMDQVVEKIGTKSNCTYCGVFRRQALDRGAQQLGVDKIVTGHNADDMAETVLMNFFRSDMMRLPQCTEIVTFDDTMSEGGKKWDIPRIKPLKYAFQKEIVLYAHYKNLDYFSTECTHSHEAFRGHVRNLVKDIERVNPQGIINIINAIDDTVALSQQRKSREGSDDTGEEKSEEDSTKHAETKRLCKRCGYMTSQELCRACQLLQQLNLRDGQSGSVLRRHERT